MSVRTSIECVQIYDIFLDIAEIMVEENCSYYDSETSIPRDKLWEDHELNLASFKTYWMFHDTMPEQICNMLKEEQLLFVLFAAQMCLTGDYPE